MKMKWSRQRDFEMVFLCMILNNAEKKRLITTSVELVRPVALKMVKIILSKVSATRLITISLCIGTVQRRIREISDQLTHVTVESVGRSCCFYYQLCEFTNIKKEACLAVSVRGERRTQFKKDLLFCA